LKSKYIYIGIAVLMIAAATYPLVVSAFDGAQRSSNPFLCAPLIPCQKESPGTIACITACTILLQDTTFVPGTVNATAGATITWHNTDGFAHTVTFFNTTLPSSGFISTGDSYSFTIPKSLAPGEYYYYCEVHPFMIGLLNVLPANTTS
jgi:hypothetical protein